MLVHNIAKNLWLKQSIQTTYIHNRCPTRSNLKITSEELYFGINPYKNWHLRVLHSYLIHVLKENIVHELPVVMPIAALGG
jgi:hypothetical protein